MTPGSDWVFTAQNTRSFNKKIQYIKFLLTCILFVEQSKKGNRSVFSTLKVNCWKMQKKKKMSHVDNNM